MAKKSKKGRRIIIKNQADFTRALNLLVFVTVIEKLMIIRKKEVKVFYVETLSELDVVVKILKENDIKFSVEE